MDRLFGRLTLVDVHRDVVRNIVSLRSSQDLFDDLTDDPSGWTLAQRVEQEIKPPLYRSPTPIIDRPFEDARWSEAILWPFKNRRASRFSDGSFGVWYGSDSVETSVHESAYHWLHGLLADAGFERERVVAERKVYRVACDAALLDFRPSLDAHPELLHPTDYRFCQSVGARIHREGHPGLLTRSVRCPAGENVAVFNPGVLSDPRQAASLTYRLEDDRIVVEKRPGKAWLVLETRALSR